MVSRALILGCALLLATPPPARADDDAARAEALILTTTFGLYQGIAISALLEDADLLPRGDAGVITAASLTLASTATAFGLTWWVTDTYGVNAAQAGAFNSATIWTMLNGLSGGIGFDLDSEEMLWNSLISGWAGQALGVMLAVNVDRTAGQVSLMNTAATWAAAEVVLWQAVFGVDDSTAYFTWPMLVADVALLTTAYFARDSKISRSRARLLDLGAFAGGLAGPAALFMVYGPEDNLREWYVSAMALGIPAGIATAWYLTRDLDRSDDPADVAGEAAAFMLPLAAGVF